MRFIAARPFLEALGNYPRATQALLGALAGQVQDTLAQLAGLRLGTNPERLAGILAHLAGAEQDAAEVQTTQQELADLLGVTRATANAALRELEQRELVKRGYGTISIPSVAQLRVLAQP